MDEAKWYTVEEAATLIQVHPVTFRRYVRERQVKAYKIGRTYRILSLDLDEFMSKRKVA